MRDRLSLVPMALSTLATIASARLSSSVPVIAGGPAEGVGFVVWRSDTAATAPRARALVPRGTAALRSRAPPRRSGDGRVVVRGRNYETNIKHKKGPAEQKKRKVTAKHLGYIILAVRAGGPDEADNPRLKTCIRLALKDNVPRSTIDKRIKKFVSQKETISEISLGGYGPGGAAVMVRCVTDNTNRCRTEVREAFKNVDGQLGQEGCVAHCFNERGLIRFEGADEEVVMEASMEADVEDCTTASDGAIEAITLPENIHNAVEAFEQQGLEASSSDVEFAPVTEAELDEAGTYEMTRLLFLLDEVDDVQDVHHTGKMLDGVELKFNPYGMPFTYERAKKG
eukprot:CAMPEP_0117592554 /NCGR_PEP_ID=MMETSP0784-20121206/72136_1 /TAXON_ID=39447 /ORGANISM="" /LENGTH=339 /DNA_ID=CAMNT_0005394367 /DNA_START=36 /DNA_END=1055 /DNA_ORIENTATION=+